MTTACPCHASPDCTTCGRRKSPVGRDVPAAAANGYCTVDCRGYADEPIAGHLWAGELPPVPCADRCTCPIQSAPEAKP